MSTKDITYYITLSKEDINIKENIYNIIYITAYNIYDFVTYCNIAFKYIRKHE